LTDLRDSIEHPRFREVIAGLIESIEGGQTLSQAMAGPTLTSSARCSSA
jgi:type IV pilus assembly protein PilC